MSQSDIEAQLRAMSVDQESKMPQQVGFDPRDPGGVSGNAPTCPLSGESCAVNCAWFNVRQGHCWIIDAVLALWDTE